ncbi:hypothetical protein ACGFYP_29145 [Streptomyces sp. NPDC048370]|uniref:hypothetical protein n=1 Tax=Streptomyces sp. NPDC048370 TaxID=3365540 RepID=UPI003712316F
MEPPEPSSPFDRHVPVAHGAYAAHTTPEEQEHNAARGGHTTREAHDDEWAGETRAAAGCAALLLALSLTIDAGTGSLNTTRAMLWIALAALLFAILVPPHVSASPGRLTVRGLWTRQSVRTDRLRSVRWSNGVSQRLVLRDTEDGRAEIDPRVLVANPALWHLVAADARISSARGTLLCGSTALDRLSRRMDRETAQTVFKVSGLQ